MNKLISKQRVLVMALLLFLLITIYLIFLYNVSIVEGEKYYSASSELQQKEETVTAARGDILDIFPAYETKAIRVEFFGDEIDRIAELDPLTGKCGVKLPAAVVTPAKQFVMGKDKFEAAFARIEEELKERLKFFELTTIA